MRADAIGDVAFKGPGGEGWRFVVHASDHSAKKLLPGASAADFCNI